MKQIILECLDQEVYSVNIINEKTEKTFQESDEDKNIHYFKEFDDLPAHLGI